MVLKGILPINPGSTMVSLGSAVSILPATATVLLATAAGVGIATGPGQAATIKYIGCGVNATSCTLTQLFNGGSITVDENDDNIVDKTFLDWRQTGIWNSNIITVAASSASTTSAELTFTANPPLSISSTNFTSFNNLFLFDVSTATNPSIALTGAELALTNSTSSGIAGVLVTAAGVGLPNLQVQNVGGVVSSPDSTPVNYSNTLEFNMSLFGFAFGGSASLSQFKMAFNQSKVSIPEPSAVVGLLAFCSLGLGMKRKQREKTSDRTVKAWSNHF